MLYLEALSRQTFSAINASNYKEDPLKQRKLVPGVKRSGRIHHVILGLGFALAALPLVAPKPALAWWSGRVWIGDPAYVAPPRYAYVPPPPIYYAPPPVVYALPVARWIPGHYNWHGFWIPGHRIG